MGQDLGDLLIAISRPERLTGAGLKPNAVNTIRITYSGNNLVLYEDFVINNIRDLASATMNAFAERFLRLAEFFHKKTNSVVDAVHQITSINAI